MVQQISRQKWSSNSIKKERFGPIFDTEFLHKRFSNEFAWGLLAKNSQTDQNSERHFFQFQIYGPGNRCNFQSFSPKASKNFSRCWCTLNTNHRFDFTTLMNFNFWHFDAKIAFCAFFSCLLKLEISHYERVFTWENIN